MRTTSKFFGLKALALISDMSTIDATNAGFDSGGGGGGGGDPDGD